MNHNRIIVDGVKSRWAFVPHAIPVQQVGFEHLVFQFGRDWWGLNIIIQFSQGENAWNLPLTDGTCAYPAELTAQSGFAEICVLGYSTGSDVPVRATVNRLRLPLVDGFREGGVPAVPPTPDLYAQLLQRTKETLEDKLREAKESGEFDGADGFSPVVTIEDAHGGRTVTITDRDGIHSYFVPDGRNGAGDGQDGFSPIVAIEQTTGGATVRVTDRYGTTSATIRNGSNGQNGAPGADGFSPVVTIEDAPGGHTVTITDRDGIHSYFVQDGQDGEDGQDGFSPIVAIEQTTGGATVRVTDRDGITSATIRNGSDATVTAENIALALGSIPATKNYVDKGTLSFTNITVPKAQIVSDSTYEDFPYRADIALAEVTERHFPEVVFDLNQDVEWASVCDSFNGGVRVYVNSAEYDLLIRTIMCWRLP